MKVQLTQEQIKEIHAYYLKTNFRLTDTWLKEQGIRISRQRLSTIFKENNLEVRPPRGGNAPYTHKRKKIDEPLLVMCEDYVTMIWSDISKYLTQKQGGSRTKFLTACSALTGELYQLALNSLALNGYRDESMPNTMIPDENSKKYPDLTPYRDQINQGKKDYMAIATFWGCM